MGQGDTLSITARVTQTERWACEACSREAAQTLLLISLGGIEGFLGRIVGNKMEAVL